VRRISGEMELRALNAAVKSARLGQEGLTLKVLADEVTKLSNGSAHFVESTIETLNRITSATAAMTNCVDADGQTADRSRDLNALLATVRAAYDGLASACTAISARAGELQERICRRASVLEFLASYSERLSAEAALLERLRKEIAPYAPNPELSLQSDERRLADRYTMESERDVFRKLTSVEQAAGDDELAVEQGGCILF